MEPHETSAMDTLYPPEKPPVPEDHSEEEVESKASETAEAGEKEPAEEPQVDAAEEADEEEVRAEDDSAEKADEEEAPDTEEVEVTSFQQLAEHLEADPEWLEGLTIKQKVNGKEVDVTLGDALETYRKVTAADDYLNDANTKRDEILAEANQQREKVNQGVATFAQLVTAAEQFLVADVNAADMKKLRDTDPAEWTARQHEINQRVNQINQLKQLGAQAAQEFFKQDPEKLEAELQKNLPEAKKVLLERLPDWSNDKVKAKEAEAVAKYMAEQGYNDDEVKFIAYSGRDLSVIVKAMRYDNLQKGKQVTQKRVTKIPKVVKKSGDKPETRKPSAKKDPISILYGKR